jgi:hypothetical protein
MQACKIEGLDPSVINHLLDLDPGTVSYVHGRGLLLLHFAVASWTPAAGDVINRMIELSPTCLFHRGIIDLPPVMYAMLYGRSVTSQRARFLQSLVERIPGTVLPRLVTLFGTSLLMACFVFRDRGLIEAVVRAFPPALCFHRIQNPGQYQLPIDIVAIRPSTDTSGETDAFLTEETILMALAAIEYALESTRNSTAASVASQSPADEFNRQVLSIVTQNLPPDLESRRLSALRGLRRYENLAVAWTFAGKYFFLPATARLARNNDVSFRDAVLGESVVNLYRMNKLGRSDPSPHHQIRLLALGCDELDCLYLQVREFGAVHLIANDRSDTTTASERSMSCRQASQHLQRLTAIGNRRNATSTSLGDLLSLPCTLEIMRRTKSIYNVFDCKAILVVLTVNRKIGHL